MAALLWQPEYPVPDEANRTLLGHGLARHQFAAVYALAKSANPLYRLNRLPREPKQMKWRCHCRIQSHAAWSGPTELHTEPGHSSRTRNGDMTTSTVLPPGPPTRSSSWLTQPSWQPVLFCIHSSTWGIMTIPRPKSPFESSMPAGANRTNANQRPSGPPCANYSIRQPSYSETSTLRPESTFRNSLQSGIQPRCCTALSHSVTLDQHKICYTNA